jgi:hypothetical protein
VTVKYERTASPDGDSLDAHHTDAHHADVLKSDPLVQKVVELFEARTVQLEYGDADANSES